MDDKRFWLFFRRCAGDVEGPLHVKADAVVDERGIALHPSSRPPASSSPSDFADGGHRNEPPSPKDEQKEIVRAVSAELNPAPRTEDEGPRFFISADIARKYIGRALAEELGWRPCEIVLFAGGLVVGHSERIDLLAGPGGDLAENGDLVELFVTSADAGPLVADDFVGDDRVVTVLVKDMLNEEKLGSGTGR